MAGERPSIRLPVTLQGFLEYTGWEGHAPRDRMAVALEYFQTELPWSYLSLPVEDPKGPDGTSLGPNPWLLPVSTRAPGKPPINLCMLMQTINFSFPVLVQLLPRGIRLKAFRTAHDPPGRLGRYFTLLPASQESLAIPHDQTTARFYEAIHSFTALASTVADAYVDSAMNRGVGPQYRHGGGRQFFVWNPALKLQPLPAPFGNPFRPIARGLLPTDRPWGRTESWAD
jgi:hypothetical protein